MTSLSPTTSLTLAVGSVFDFFFLSFSQFFLGGTRFFFPFLILIQKQISGVNHFWKYSPFSGVYSFFILPHIFFDSILAIIWLSILIFLDLETWW